MRRDVGEQDARKRGINQESQKLAFDSANSDVSHAISPLHSACVPDIEATHSRRPLAAVCSSRRRMNIYGAFLVDKEPRKAEEGGGGEIEFMASSPICVCIQR